MMLFVPATPLPQRSRHPSFKQNDRCSITASVADNNSKGGSNRQFQLPDFNRDYYDDLKAEYADDANVKIYSREDYKLDPLLVPWLYQYRARDINVIRENVRKRVEAHKRNKELKKKQKIEERKDNNKSMDEDEDEDEDVDEEGFPPDAICWTDLHTEEEMSSLRERALTTDIATGKLWNCPMTKEELELSEEDDHYVHFRPDSEDENTPGVRPLDDGFTYWGNDPVPEYVTESEAYHEAISELKDSWYYMSSEFKEPALNSQRWGESDTVPDQSEYQRWKEEAEKRGGNAVLGQSHALSPYNDISSTDPKRSPHIDLPPQHDVLVNAYTGAWAGEIQVFSLDNRSQSSLSDKVEKSPFQPVLEKVIPIQSDVSQLKDGSLHVHTNIQLSQNDDDTLKADTVFSLTGFYNGLSRGRAVSSDASYICIPVSGCNKALDLSIPLDTLSQLTSGSVEAKSAIEIGLVCPSSANVKQNQKSVRRHRIFLLTEGEPVKISSIECLENKPARKSRSVKPFSHVLLITENKYQTNDEAEEAFHSLLASETRSSLPSMPLEKLIGRWTGKGLLLQPEYVADGIRHVDTKYKMDIVQEGSISEEDITTVEDEFEAPPGEESKRKVRQQGKKKVSARVAAARAYDKKRLGVCNLRCSDQIGDISPEEIHAWKTWTRSKDSPNDKHQTPGTNQSDQEVLFMTSPRIGRFVVDYASLVLSDKLILSFPQKDAFPAMWNTISLEECGTPERRRIVVGRSEEGILVGGLFAAEVLQAQGSSPDEEDLKNF